MKRGGVLAALGTKERLGVEWGVACPKKHPFQKRGQELTHLLPASTLYSSEGHGFWVQVLQVGWAAGI